MRLIVGAVALSFLAGCGHFLTPSTYTPSARRAAAERAERLAAASGPSAADRKVCRQYADTGSNMPKRVCATTTEWARYDQQGKEQVESFDRDVRRLGHNLPCGEQRPC